jgi:AmmeMemoRadiSam system protein B
MIREPVVSGQFYPKSQEELISLIQSFEPDTKAKIAAKGLILPHAGYIYSGRVAVTTLNQVLGKKRLIILGPNHTGVGEEFGLWAKGRWKIPQGEIAIDQELGELILSKGQIVKEDYLAHQNEHSIEVELPILSYFLGEFKFVPIACKSASLATCQEVAGQIFEAIKNIKNEVLLVASTDLTHYEPDPVARKKDRAAIEAIVDLDHEELYRKVSLMNISMCGLIPVAILISCLKKLGATKSQVALYQTSGDSEAGDKNSVVGYAGMIIK